MILVRTTNFLYKFVFLSKLDDGFNEIKNFAEILPYFILEYYPAKFDISIKGERFLTDVT